VPPEQLAQPRRLNPGHHTIQAGSVERQVDLAEGDAKKVSLEGPATATAGGPAEPAAQAAAPAEASEAASDAAPTAEAPASGRSPAASVLTIGGFGVAGAGIILGAVTGLMTLTTTSSIKSSGHCYGDTCGPEEYDRITSANTTATIANVSFAVAGAGLAAGLVGLLLPKTGGSPAQPASENGGSTTSRIEPWLGIGSAGVRGRF
jgi:hypothetical protein